VQIVINGRLLNYIEVNPKGKKNLIILHGWAHNAALWQNLAGKLDKDIRCFLVDLPAFGSSQALSGNPSVPEYNKTIIDLVKKLELKKPVILGHSFGGQVALDLATKHPNLLSKIILVSPAGVRKKTFKAGLVKTLAKIAKPFKSAGLFQQIRKRLAPDYANANPEQKIVLRNIVKYDLSPKLHLIKVPAHIIWGSEDRQIPYLGKFINDQIEDSRLHVLYGAGHNPHLTHTDQLAKLINDIVNA